MIGDLFAPMHLLLILAIALIIFGPGKLPELGSSLGKAIREFKKVMEMPESKPEPRETKIESPSVSQKIEDIVKGQEATDKTPVHETQAHPQS